MTTPIRVGKGRGGLELDPRKIVSSCMLIQGTRGSGKSYLARLIAEKTIPQGIQTIILDPEGEYATLREKCEVLIAGEGGDVPCEVRSAKILARRIAELGCSTVVDISRLRGNDPFEFVADFLSTLDRLPKQLEAQRLIVLDEAHRFCPESGKGRATSAEAVVLLMSQGRKRGLGCILVTQRLSKLRNDAAAEAGTIMIGRTSPIDVKRAQDLLGITATERDSLRSLDPGEFYATGPSLLSKTDIVRFAAKKAETTHPEPGMQTRPRPPRGSMKRLIADLGDLPPSEAQQEAESLADAQRQLAVAHKRIAELEQNSKLRRTQEALERERTRLRLFRSSAAKLVSGARTFLETFQHEIDDIEHHEPDLEPDPDPKPSVVRKRRPVENEAAMEHLTRAAKQDGMNSGMKKVLCSIHARHNVTGQPVDRMTISVVSGFSPTSGTFSKNIAQLVAGGFIDRKNGGFLPLFDAPGPLPPAGGAELAQAVLRRVPSGQQRIFQALLDHGPKLSRDDIAGLTGYSKTSGTFSKNLANLKSRAYIEGRHGQLRLSDIFTE